MGNLAKLIAIDRYGRTARYFVEYPEDLEVFGISFNTLLGNTGWSLQGEYSFKPDTPLQQKEDVLFKEGLGPIVEGLTVGLDRLSQEARDKLGKVIPGYITKDVSQAQVSGIRVFGPVIGADSLLVATEVAVSHVHNITDAELKDLATTGRDATADATSFGYRLAARLDYNNALGAARLSPYVQFQHDLKGSGPAPGAPFVEGRTVLTLGIGLNYLENIRSDLSYTMYGGEHNYLKGRDFISLSASYSF